VGRDAPRSPIRALLEADAEHGGLEAVKRDSVRLYYGAQDDSKMAFTSRFKAWEASGVTVVPVFSQGDGGKYVQAAFTAEALAPPAATTFVVLCGQKGMSEGVAEAMVAVGIPKEQFITNF
jgi:NAD(P)H-flavin reductase